LAFRPALRALRNVDAVFDISNADEVFAGPGLCAGSIVPTPSELELTGSRSRLVAAAARNSRLSETIPRS
jgi:hypothetical protein